MKKNLDAASHIRLLACKCLRRIISRTMIDVNDRFTASDVSRDIPSEINAAVASVSVTAVKCVYRSRPGMGEFSLWTAKNLARKYCETGSNSL